jgi:hypothetical protein
MDENQKATSRALNLNKQLRDVVYNFETKNGVDGPVTASAVAMLFTEVLALSLAYGTPDTTIESFLDEVRSEIFSGAELMKSSLVKTVESIN